MAARRMLRATVLGGALGIAAVLGLAGPAQAHDRLVGSTPAQGETLTALPDAFSVTLNEPLVVNGLSEANFGMQVTDAAGRYYGDGCLSFVDATMSMPATLGSAGDYTLVWQALSADSHPVGEGLEVHFSWAPPADFEPSTGSVKPPVCGAPSDETPTAQPEPEMTTQGEPTSTAAPMADGGTDVSSTVAWIGGAALAIIVAVGVTLLLVRPRKPVDAVQGAPDGAAERDETDPRQ
jgi:methionine-rich copper-binding protein CopC